MILPLHPQPKHDELLTSWMMRLSFANGYFPHTFFNKVLSYKGPLWNRDLDRYCTQSLMDVLSHVTRQDIEVVRKLTFNDYEGFLINKITVNGNSRWIIPVGIYHRKFKRRSMQFCPLCIKENSYYRKQWRLALFTICEKHRCFLYEQCPHCGAFLSFHRLGIGIKEIVIPDEELGQCFQCHLLLKSVEPEYIDDKASIYISSYMKMLACVIAKKQNKLKGKVVNNVEYYNGIRCLINAVIGRYGAELRMRIYLETGIEIIMNNDKLIGFEYLPNTERRDIMLAISWVLTDWPDNFRKIYKAGQYIKSCFIDYKSTRPKWLELQLNEY